MNPAARSYASLPVARRVFKRGRWSKMTSMHERPGLSNLIAVDIGNSRIKLGAFSLDGAATGLGHSLPEPAATFDLPIDNETGSFDADRLRAWCEKCQLRDATWQVASVHRAAAARLIATLAEWAGLSAIAGPARLLTYRDVPLKTRVEEPERLGIDRLLAALAADRLRRRDRAAIIVDLGTATTIDLLEADGVFAGGAILPGIAMSARALSEQTDALPRVALEFLDKPPAPLGKSTVPAIESGIYWGTVGAIRELIARLAERLEASPDIFITGGASVQFTELLTELGSVRHVPNLVLSGIALVKS